MFGLPFRVRVRRSDIRMELRVKPLLLHVEKEPIECLNASCKRFSRCVQSGVDPRAEPRTCWRDFISRHAWERDEIPPPPPPKKSRRTPRPNAMVSWMMGHMHKQHVCTKTHKRKQALLHFLHKSC